MFKITLSEQAGIENRSAVRLVSSSGLRILLNIYKHIHGYDHWVILKGMSEDIKEVLGLGGFLQLFHTED